MKILIAKAFAKIMLDGVLARELKHRGHDVQLLLPQRGPDCDEIERLGIPILINPVIQMRYLRRTSLFEDLIWFIRLVSLLRREKYDVINLHLPAARLFGRLAARLVPPTRIVSVMHGLESHHERWSNRFDHATVCVSQAVHDNLVAYGLPSDKLKIIPNGIDLNRIDAIPVDRHYLHRELGLEAHMRLIGMIAYFYEQRDSVDKGHGLFIDAAGILSKRYPDLRFLIIGNDRLVQGREDFFKEYARQKGLGNKIFFLGERDDIFPILDSLTVHVFPSFKEGFGMVLLEAMARGTINIASDLPCVREIITDLQHGLLFEPGQTDQMIEKISRVLDAPQWADILARQARQRVQQAFMSDRMGDRYERLFKNLFICNVDMEKPG